jgi:hypothetical protein
LAGSFVLGPHAVTASNAATQKFGLIADEDTP